MFTIARHLRRRLAALRMKPDKGTETVQVMLWVAVAIVIVGAVGLILRNDLQAFFNGIVYDIGFTR